MLEHSMSANNYGEAYKYCNKALEIDPKNASLWEKKAICVLYTVHYQYIDQAIPQATAYLNTASSLNPNSPTLKGASETIADYIYSATRQALLEIAPDLPNGQYSYQLVNFSLKKVLSWEDCYHIHNNLDYLKGIVNELSSDFWVSAEPNVPTAHIRKRITTLIQSQEPNYKPPRIKGSCFIVTATMGNAEHPTVIFLQQFRDRCLKQLLLGRVFINIYYTIGPFFAKVIEKCYMARVISYCFIVQPSVFIAKFCIYFSQRKGDYDLESPKHECDSL